ncbi:MAG TPA: NADH-quinone oxidoreductase subunit A [Candidatus Aquicultor sp.]|jgi:NADH-quinone oxidoreductase subunit A
MTSDIIYFATFITVGIVVVVGMLGSSKLLQKALKTKKPSEAKLMAYECGVPDISGDPRIQFKVRYYIFALLLVIFDIEMIFIFPWAVVFKSLGIVSLVEMLVFIAILLLGLVYAWRKGALKWV